MSDLQYADPTDTRLHRLERHLWMWRALAFVNLGVSIFLLALIAYWIVPKFVL